MKKTAFLMFLLVMAACKAPVPTDKTVVEGIVEGLGDGMVYIMYTDDEGFKNDSVEVSGGKFTWIKDKLVPMSVRMSLTYDKYGQDPNSASFWTDPGLNELTLKADDMEDYTLKGGTTDAEAKAYQKMQEPLKPKMEEIYERYSAVRGTDDEAAVRAELDSLNLESNKIVDRFINEYPGSYVAASLIHSYSSQMSQEEAIRYLDMLEGPASQSSYAKMVRREIQGEKDGQPGAKAPLFATTDIDGERFDMAELVGKNPVIIDFWASWCGPCRKMNPHLKELYEKYRDRGLVVVCVADDDSSPDDWRKAVEEDGLQDFVHVLRGMKGMEYFFDRDDDISDKYGIHTLPTKFLIGMDGVILGRYGGGGEPHEAMDDKLVEVFGY